MFKLAIALIDRIATHLSMICERNIGQVEDGSDPESESESENAANEPEPETEKSKTEDADVTVTPTPSENADELEQETANQQPETETTSLPSSEVNFKIVCREGYLTINELAVWEWFTVTIWMVDLCPVVKCVVTLQPFCR